MKPLFFYILSVTVIVIFPAKGVSSSQGLHQTFRLGSDFFKGIPVPKNDLTLSLKNNKVDVSSVVQVVEQLKKTDYADDLRKMENLILNVSKYEVQDLCKKALSLKICVQTAKQEMEKAFDKVIEAKEKDILFPINYKPVGVDSKTTLFDYESIKEDCNRSMNSNMGASVLESSPALYHKMMEHIKKKDPFWQEQLLSYMIGDLTWGKRVPKACLKSQTAQNSRVCQKIKKDFKIKRQRFYEMVDLVHGPSLDRTTIAKTLCFECFEMQIDDFDWDKLVQSLKETSQCVDPKPGEQKTVHSETLPRYRKRVVQRELDGSFSVPLNLTFYADEDYDGDVPKSQVPSHYRDKVKQCMNKANTKMLGPNGEQLKFVIQEPPKDLCQKNNILSVDIAIGKKGMRSNSEKYEPNVGCSTIVHEVLHLAGLCDEYRESVKGYYVDPETKEVIGNTDNKWDDVKQGKNPESADFSPMYDCRVTDYKPNIMSNHQGRWKCVFPEEEGNIHLCSEREERSLLNPAQFRAIIYGSCVQNKRFNECSRLAYTSTATEGEDCLKAQKKCIEQNGMGTRDKAEEINKINQRLTDLTRIRNQLKHQITEPVSAKPTPSLDTPKEPSTPLGDMAPALKDDFEAVDSGGTGTNNESGESEPLDNKGPGGLIENKGPGGLAPVTSRSRDEELKDINQSIKELRKELRQVKSWPD